MHIGQWVVDALAMPSFVSVSLRRPRSNANGRPVDYEERDGAITLKEAIPVGELEIRPERNERLESASSQEWARNGRKRTAGGKKRVTPKGR